jgi:O-antigen ligase
MNLSINTNKIHNYSNNLIFFLLLVFPITLIIGTAASESIVIIIDFIFLITINRNIKIIKKAKLLLFLLSIIWISLIINLIFSNEQSLSLSRNIFFFRYIIFVLAIFSVTKENLKKIILFWAIVISVVLFDVYYEFFNYKNLLGFISYDPTRIASFFGKELIVGSFLLGIGFICLGYCFQQYNFNKKLFLLQIFLLFILIMGIFITGERSNFLKGFFITAIFIFFLRNKIFVYIRSIILLSMLSIFFLTTFFLSNSSKFNNLLSRYTVQIFNKTTTIGIKNTFENSQHAAHYDTALKIFKDYPFFGAGNKNFRAECAKEKYYNTLIPKTNERCSTHPHQIYFELLSEHGLVGTITILLVFFYIIAQNIKKFRTNKNYVHLASLLFIIATFFPLIPSGSFFNSYSASVFWLNFGIMNYYLYINSDKHLKN